MSTAPVTTSASALKPAGAATPAAPKPTLRRSFTVPAGPKSKTSASASVAVARAPSKSPKEGEVRCGVLAGGGGGGGGGGVFLWGVR
jgi:hypothetical protein